MLAKPMTGNASALLTLLTTGRDNGSITEERPMLSRNIAALLNFDGRERSVRHAVNELRMSGHPIASGDRGYFLASNLEQLLPTIRTLFAKARETAKPGRALFHLLEMKDQLTLSSEFE